MEGVWRSGGLNRKAPQKAWLSWRMDGAAIETAWFPEPGFLPSWALQRSCTAPGTMGAQAGAGL